MKKISNKDPITVTELNRYLKSLLNTNPNLVNITVKGEIQNSRISPSGHLYFKLKDENTGVNCVLFSYSRKKRNLKLKEGMSIILTGKVDLYLPQGQYQIIVNEIIKDGIGNLYIELEKLKKKLNKEGLFNDEDKKEIPKIPKRIGVVTSPKGAVIKDIITTTKRRWPYCEILLFPSLVQGENAPKQIIQQIKNSQKYKIDTLIVGRGGGSIEDLWCFNDEKVARTIYECQTPIISAVGHETDYTIVDYVADKRAPTPTAAAELAVPDSEHIKSQVNQLNIRLQESIKSKLNENQQRLDNIREKQMFKKPTTIYKTKKENLNILTKRFQLSSEKLIIEKENRLAKTKNSYIIKNPEKIIETQKRDLTEYIEKLEILNPLSTLKRGYSLSRINGKIISSAKKLKKEDEIEIEFKDGKINTKVV